MNYHLFMLPDCICFVCRNQIMFVVSYNQIAFCCFLIRLCLLFLLNRLCLLLHCNLIMLVIFLQSDYICHFAIIRCYYFALLSVYIVLFKGSSQLHVSGLLAPTPQNSVLMDNGQS